MKVIYISPNSVNPHLFPRFRFEETKNVNEATHRFIEVVSGDTGYLTELNEIISGQDPPMVCFDNREYGTMKNEKWEEHWSFADIYFIRNMNKKEEYPSFCYPFDWPYFSGCGYEPVSKEELFSRPYDCCLISVDSPTRQNVISGIIKDGRLKLNYQFRDYTQRLPYNQWVDEHRKAKLYIACDGGGYTEERPQQLFTIAPMLKVINDHLPAHPFTDGYNCLEISEYPTKDEIDKIITVLNDKDWLYDIYLKGIEHTKKYNSPEGVTNYILECLKKENLL